MNNKINFIIVYFDIPAKCLLTFSTVCCCLRIAGFSTLDSKQILLLMLSFDLLFHFQPNLNFEWRYSSHKICLSHSILFRTQKGLAHPQHLSFSFYSSPKPHHEPSRTQDTLHNLAHSKELIRLMKIVWSKINCQIVCFLIALGIKYFSILQ